MRSYIVCARSLAGILSWHAMALLLDSVHPMVPIIILLLLSTLAAFSTMSFPGWWLGGLPRAIALAMAVALSWTAGGFATSALDKAERDPLGQTREKKPPAAAPIAQPVAKPSPASGKRQRGKKKRA